MSGVWWPLIIRLSILSLLGVVVWQVDDLVSALAVVLVVLLFMLFHHTRHLARLSKWLADPRPEAVPAGTGIWEDVFAAFYHLLRRQKRSESRLTATLHDFQRAGPAMPDGLVILDGANRIDVESVHVSQSQRCCRRRVCQACSWQHVLIVYGYSIDAFFIARTT